MAARDRANRRNRARRARRSGRSGRNTSITFRETLLDINFAPFVINHQQIVPTRFPWAKDLALKFSEYKITALSIHWCPAGAATDAGQVVGGFTFDSFEKIPDNYARVSQLAQHKLDPVHRPTSWRLPVSRLAKVWWPVLSEADLTSLPVSQRLPYLPAIFHFGLRSDRVNGQLAGSLEVVYTLSLTMPDWTGAQDGEAVKDVRELLDVPIVGPTTGSVPPPSEGDSDEE
jgi:hypothetical protein